MALAGTGCTPRVALQAQRTPKLDTKGIQRVAIMPFEAAGGHRLYEYAAQQATTIATGKIQATNHFTLVDPSRVRDARRRGESVESYVDALFQGKILRVGEETDVQRGERKDKDGNIVRYTVYDRRVEVEYTYSFAKVRDGTLIGPLTKVGRAGASADSRSELPSGSALVSRALESSMGRLYQDVAPYTIRIYRTMEKDPNKALKPQMDAALARVKSGNYVAARQSYIDIWHSGQSVAAAVNASILYEAMGETEEAAAFMQGVVSATGSPMARSVLARLNNEIGEMAGVEKFADTRSPTEKAASYAVSEIQSVIPEGAKLLILNNSAPNDDLAANVVDNMISAFSKSGVPVVERQIIDAAIEELKFQMSGSVSDDDIVSVGNFAGANVIVVVDIIGSGTGRRLHVKALDVKTATVLMQSSSDSEWKL
jgi:hypothetical protein